MLRQLILLQIYEAEILLVLHIYIPQQPGRKHLAATKTEKKCSRERPLQGGTPTHNTHTTRSRQWKGSIAHTALRGLSTPLRAAFTLTFQHRPGGNRREGNI